MKYTIRLEDKKGNLMLLSQGIEAESRDEAFVVMTQGSVVAQSCVVKGDIKILTDSKGFRYMIFEEDN